MSRRNVRKRIGEVVVEDEKTCRGSCRYLPRNVEREREARGYVSIRLTG
jgi:hypothetical protein